MAEFGDGLDWRFVMGGLAREYANHKDVPALMVEWLDAADRGGMPLDPRIWTQGPLASTYPASMAVKAAAEQAPDAGYAYLRALREGIFCFRRKLDSTEALVEEARGARLDVERFRIDLASHATVESFGTDLEWSRRVPAAARGLDGAVVQIGGGRERLVLPSAVFSGEDGSEHWVFGFRPYEDWRAAAEAAGAVALDTDRPAPLEAIRRFGRMATTEVASVCGLPGPRAAAELWMLACEWRLRPIKVLTGHLWEPA